MELERHRDLAFGTALSLLGDYHRAEDAVQEAFVEAIRCWDRLENREARGAWLRGIVRHRCFRILSATKAIARFFGACVRSRVRCGRWWSFTTCGGAPNSRSRPSSTCLPRRSTTGCTGRDGS